MKKVLSIVVIVACLAASAQAAVIVIDNSSFETATGGVADGWSTVGVHTFATSAWATDGVQSQQLGLSVGGVSDVIYQTTSYAAAAGDLYELTFDGRINDGSISAGVEIGYKGILYYDDAGTRVELASAQILFDDTTPRWGGGFGDWHGLTINYTVAAGDAAIGKNLGFSFESVSTAPAAWSAYSNVDNVQLSTVPEPATIALFGMGCLSLLRRKRS